MWSGVVFGGCIAGVAREAGIVIGLRRAGVDLSSADVIVGIPAGSVAGAHVAFGTGWQALAAMTAAPREPTPPRVQAPASVVLVPPWQSGPCPTGSESVIVLAE